MAELTDTQDGLIVRLSEAEIERLEDAVIDDRDRADGFRCLGPGGVPTPTLIETVESIVREHTERTLVQVEKVVRGRREAFLPSPNLAPGWIAGWHAAVDHVAHVVRGFRQERDR